MNKPYETDLGNKEIFIRNLKRYLAQTSTTQSDLARIANVSTGTVSDWTKGRTYPRMDKIQAMADYFGIKKSDLVEEPEVEDDQAAEDREVLDLFHKIPKEKREFILSIIRSAADNL